MVDPKLAEYIFKKRQLGASDESIGKELLDNHWPTEIVDEALGIRIPQNVHLFGIGELFSETFKMFKNRFFSILILLLFPGLLIGFVAVTYGIMAGILSTFAHAGTTVMIIGILLGIMIMIAFIIIQMWSTVAVMTSLCSTEKISFVEAFKQSWKNVFAFFAINFIIGCIALGGIFLLVIPAIIFSIWFIFSNYVLILDNEKGFRALMTSKEYVKGYWWTVFGRLTLVGVIYFLVYILLELVFVIFKSESSSLVGSLISFLVNMFGSIFMMCYSFQIFRNLRDVKGKFTLEVTKKSKVIFTLICIIGILGIFAIPAVALLVAIDPAKQIAKANTIKLESDKQQISYAIEEYYAQNKSLPKSLTDLTPSFLKMVPVATDNDSCFTATVNPSSGKITVNYVKRSASVCNQVILD